MRALLLASLSTLLACGDAPPPTDGQVEGALLATALVDHLGSSLQESAPFRCARVQADRATPILEGMEVSMEGAVVQFENLLKKKSLKIAAIADARGSDAQTLDGIAKLRERFAKQDIDVVLSLGGHGASLESQQAILSAIASDATYLTVALPGDRESVPAHRASVSELSKSGAKIIDGAQYRVLSFGKVVVATMPGISMRENLIAKDDGCLHTKDDSAELLRHLPSGDAAVLVASYAPIRQESARGSDIGAGGIHIGEGELTSLRTNESTFLLVHGMVTPPGAPASGKLKLGQGKTSLAAGSLDPLDDKSRALVISITGKKVVWKRVEAAP